MSDVGNFSNFLYSFSSYFFFPVLIILIFVVFLTVFLEFSRKLCIFASKLSSL